VDLDTTHSRACSAIPQHSFWVKRPLPSPSPLDAPFLSSDKHSRLCPPPPTTPPHTTPPTPTTAPPPHHFPTVVKLVGGTRATATHHTHCAAGERPHPPTKTAAYHLALVERAPRRTRICCGAAGGSLQAVGSYCMICTPHPMPHPTPPTFHPTPHHPPGLAWPAKPSLGMLTADTHDRALPLIPWDLFSPSSGWLWRLLRWTITQAPPPVREAWDLFGQKGC